MALVLADRVLETTTTAGSGTITLAGAKTGYQSFSAIGNGNSTYYTIALQNGAEWEVGIGTYTASGTTLSRDTVLSSSAGGAKVTFSAGTKDVFVDYPAEKALYPNESGNISAMSGKIINLAEPTVATDATTKQYVDDRVSTGLVYHEAVQLSSTSAFTSYSVTYNNGTSGVSATLTQASSYSSLTIDGTGAAVNNRILIKDASNAAYNGIYYVNSTGSGSTPWVMTRTSDADTYGPAVGQLSLNDYFFTQNGVTNKGTAFVVTTQSAIIFGTTPITFSEFSNSQVYSAGNGLSLTATTFALATPVSVPNGGTGNANWTVNGLLYASNGTTLTNGSQLVFDGTNLGVGKNPTTAIDVSGTITSTNFAGTSANITTLTGTSADITTITGTTIGTTAATNLRGSSANITTITGTSANITTINGTSANVTTVTGTTAGFSSANITTLSGTTVTYTSATVTNLALTSLTLSNLSITSANITTLTGTTATYTSAAITNLSGTSAQITTITGTNIGTSATTQLQGLSASITTLTTTSGTVTNLNSTSANITTLTGTTFGTTATTQLRGASAAITTLTGTSADITTISGTTIGTTASSTIQGISANITNLNSTSAQITTLTGTTFGTTATTQLRGASAAITTITGTSADITTISGTTIGTTATTQLKGASASITTISGTSATVTNILDGLGLVRNIPQSSAKTAAYTLVTADNGTHILTSSGTITVPNNTFAAGNVVSIYNNSANTISLTLSTTTAYVGGTNTNRTGLALATRGLATILFINPSACVVAGNVT